MVADLARDISNARSWNNDGKIEWFVCVEKVALTLLSAWVNVVDVIKLKKWLL